MVKLALHAAAVLLPLLLLQGVLTENLNLSPIEVVVENSLLGAAPLTYSTHVAYRGILIGALRRLMESNAGFTFTSTEHPDYGAYLESVNGLAGSDEDRTYWELLVRTPDGKIIRPDVGIGCYIPREKERIILRLSRW
uniref:Uncharacterized protein n=1 Tax=Cynoglossus semilaevis TaxID=244447 RepID=A0A3P8V2S5_CYNSE